MRYYEDILAYRGLEPSPAALCLVVGVTGSTPRKVGAKMLVFANRKLYGTIGGGNLEKKVVEEALQVLDDRKPRIFHHALLQEHAMCCGGTMDIFIEPLVMKPKLYIFGAGHTGRALARFSRRLDFDVFLLDDRPEYLQPDDELSGVRMNCGSPEDLWADLVFDDNTFISIMTYDHEMDRKILAYCLNQPHAYLGMIGSRRKILITKKRFKDSGIADVATLSKIDMPMGLDIGAEGPEEIALSIAARLVRIKNGKS